MGSEDDNDFCKILNAMTDWTRMLASIAVRLGRLLKVRNFPGV